MKYRYLMALLLTGFILTASFPAGQGQGKEAKKDKGQSEQVDKKDNQGKKGQGNNQRGEGRDGKPDQAEKGQKDNANRGQGQGKGQNQGQGRGEAGQDNADRGQGKGNARGNNKGREAGNDRGARSFKGYRNGNKVTVCHKENGINEGVTIEISENALDAHLAHGDTKGACTFDTKDDRDRDVKVIERRREVRSDYFTTVAEAEDLLDIANHRLEVARQDLANARVRLDVLTDNPDVEVDVVTQRTQLVQDIESLVTNLERQAQVTERKLNRDRDVVLKLSLD